MSAIVNSFTLEKSENSKKDEEASPKLEEVPFEVALQIIGFGKVQVQTLILCGLILMAVLNETLGMGVIIPAAKCDLQLSSVQTGIFSSITYLGIVISSHFWGYIADTKGRRKLIIYTIFLSNFCTLVSSFSINYNMLIVSRFFTGFFISAGSGAIYVYLGEFNTIKNRATVISWASISVGVSYLFVAATGWLVLSQNWSITISDEFIFKPWRFLLIIYAIPGFFGAVCLCWLPETPKFLLAQGRDSEALTILAWIYGKNSNNSPEKFSVRKLKPEFNKENDLNQSTKGLLLILQSMWQQTAPLLKPPYGVHFFVCCFMQFGVFAVSCGLGLWFPEIINRVASNNSTNHKTICQMLAPTLDGSESKVGCNDEVNSEVFINTLGIGGLYVVIFTMVSLLMKPVGRGRILTFCLFVGGLCGLLLQWINEPISVVILFCMFLVMPGICIAVINGATVGLFPTTLRAMAVSITLLYGRIGTVIASNTVGSLLELSCDATFLIFVVICFACGFANFLLPSK